MKIKNCFLIIFLLFGVTCLQAQVTNPNRVILPNNFPVYVLGTTVLNHPAPGPRPGFQKKILPTDNRYQGYPGCYVVCYSHNDKHSVYSVGNNIFVKGQIRVPGHYEKRICHPQSFRHKDISRSVYFKNLCDRVIKACHHNCWAGGDTGGWFGIK